MDVKIRKEPGKAWPPWRDSQVCHHTTPMRGDLRTQVGCLSLCGVFLVHGLPDDTWEGKITFIPEPEPPPVNLQYPPNPHSFFSSRTRGLRHTLTKPRNHVCGVYISAVGLGHLRALYPNGSAFFTSVPHAPPYIVRAPPALIAATEATTSTRDRSNQSLESLFKAVRLPEDAGIVLVPPRGNTNKTTSVPDTHPHTSVALYQHAAS